MLLVNIYNRQCFFIYILFFTSGRGSAASMSGRGHAFARLISQQALVHLTNDFLSWVAIFSLPCVGLISIDLGVECSEWYVQLQSEGMS